MLINPYADGEARPASEQQDVSRQKYETMQCFAVSEPKSIKEEGEGIGCPAHLSPSLFPSSVPVPRVLSSFHHHFFRLVLPTTVRLIIVWHFVMLSSYLITQMHTRGQESVWKSKFRCLTTEFCASLSQDGGRTRAGQTAGLGF